MVPLLFIFPNLKKNEKKNETCAYRFNESKHINLTDCRQQNSHDRYRESALTTNFESKNSNGTKNYGSNIICLLINLALVDIIQTLIQIGPTINVNFMIFMNNNVVHSHLFGYFVISRRILHSFHGEIQKHTIKNVDKPMKIEIKFLKIFSLNINLLAMASIQWWCTVLCFLCRIESCAR